MKQSRKINQQKLKKHICVVHDGKKDFKCKFCDKEYVIILDERDFDAWQNGDGYIQDVLGYLTASDRELLISQTCDDCWKKLYGENDE